MPRLPGGGYRTAVAGLAVLFLMSGLWQVEAMRRAQGAGEVGDIRYPGALALAAGEPAPAPLLPPPVSVTDDWVHIERWDCAPMTRFPMNTCTRPVEAAQRRIVVVGDSHAQQLAGALVPIADRHGWQLTVIARGACPFSTASEVVAAEPDCLAWGDAAAAEIADLRPDAVVTLASRDVRAGVTERTPPGFVARWQQLAQLGIPVLAIRDNPRFDRSMPDCARSAWAHSRGPNIPAPTSRSLTCAAWNGLRSTPRRRRGRTCPTSRRTSGSSTSPTGSAGRTAAPR